jgi:hypothetical protein
MTITGWDVSINTQQLTVSTAQDIVVVVKDEKGVAVNNAAVRLTFGADVKTIKPSTHNIQDGTYTFAGVKYATPGVATVEVFAKESDMTAVPPVAAKVTFDVNVLGHNVYSVTSATTGLLLGKATKVQLTVTENGVPFVPAVLKVQLATALRPLSPSLPLIPIRMAYMMPSRPPLPLITPRTSLCVQRAQLVTSVAISFFL